MIVTLFLIRFIRSKMDGRNICDFHMYTFCLLLVCELVFRIKFGGWVMSF